MQKVILAVKIAKKSFLEKKILNPHVLILGDNQKVLKDIKDTYEHQVSLIYILIRRIIEVMILSFIKILRIMTNG